MVHKTTTIYGERLDSLGPGVGAGRPAVMVWDICALYVMYGTIYGLASRVYGPWNGVWVTKWDRGFSFSPCLLFCYAKNNNYILGWNRGEKIYWMAEFVLSLITSRETIIYIPICVRGEKIYWIVYWMAERVLSLWSLLFDTLKTIIIFLVGISERRQVDCLLDRGFRSLFDCRLASIFATLKTIIIFWFVFGERRYIGLFIGMRIGFSLWSLIGIHFCEETNNNYILICVRGEKTYGLFIA